MDLQKVEKMAKLESNDHSVGNLEKIINILKSNETHDGIVSAVAIRKSLKIKSKPRRIEINDCLKLALENGDLEQVTGKGANGSFRLPSDTRNKKFVLKKKPYLSPEY